ncbi:MAG: N-acetylneuraminate synthase family protein [Candidatus Odinarchaeota archaeon]
MATIALDISANTHKNNWNYLKKMLDELKKVDTGKHEIIIKHQLFIKAGNNIPLNHEIFIRAYNYAKKLGYKTTSSVFDKYSLDFLMSFDIPFVKIANNRDLDWLIGEIPRKMPICVSFGSNQEIACCNLGNVQKLLCVSKYPCNIEDYNNTFFGMNYLVDSGYGLSDHTTNWDLFNEFNPDFIEVHYKLKNSTGLDAGEFARTPKQLSEVL